MQDKLSFNCELLIDASENKSVTSTNIEFHVLKKLKQMGLESYQKVGETGFIIKVPNL